MKKYHNINGKSEIESYESGEDFIKIKLSHSRNVHVYNYENTPKNHVDKMNKLAEKGSGLWRYLLQNCKKVHSLGIKRKKWGFLF